MTASPRHAIPSTGRADASSTTPTTTKVAKTTKPVADQCVDSNISLRFATGFRLYENRSISDEAFLVATAELAVPGRGGFVERSPISVVNEPVDIVLAAVTRNR
jgi:hypothetical protein